MSDTVAIVITLIVYKVVLVTIGIVVERRNRSNEDFFLGGRKLGPWVSAISASASSSSAWTLLSVSGMAFAKGVSALWLFPACVGGFLLNWFLVAPRLRRFSAQSGAVTLTEVLAGSRPSAVRRLVIGTASVIVVFSLTVYVGTQFHAAGKTFEAMFGIQASTSIVIGAAIVLLYTLLGGFWAVSITDTLQGLLMAATAVILPMFALIEVGGPASP